MGIISLSLNEIETYFSTTRSVTVWIITIFSISSAIGIISLGFLSQIFGRKLIYLCGVIGFTVFSGLCGLSNSFESLLLFRGLQGFFGSGLVALSQALVVDSFSQEKRSKAISAWTFGLLAGPVIGPLLGGFIIENYSWRLVFFINVPLGLSAFFGLMFFLNDNMKRSKSKINTLGFIFLLYGFVEGFHYNGALTILVFGLVIANSKKIPLNILEFTNIEKTLFSEIIFIVKTFFFVYLGICLSDQLNQTSILLIGGIDPSSIIII